MLPASGPPKVQWSGGKLQEVGACPSPGTGDSSRPHTGGIELDHSNDLLSGTQKFHATIKKNLFIAAFPSTLTTQNSSEYHILFGQYNDKSDLITGVVYGYDSSYGYFAAMRYRWKDHE